MAGIGAKSKYKEEFCESLIKHMAEGYSYSTWGVDNNISTSTMYRWESDGPDWTEAKDIGYHSGLKLFESILISNSQGLIPDDLKDKGSTGVNTSGLKFILKTRYHKIYSEINKVEHSEVDNTPIQVNFVKPDPDAPA